MYSGVKKKKKTEIGGSYRGFPAAEFDHHAERFMHKALGRLQNVITELNVVSEQDCCEGQPHFHIRKTRDMSQLKRPNTLGKYTYFRPSLKV